MSEAFPPARRRSAPVAVGGVVLGGGRPVAVQSMTDTPTADAAATAAQVEALARAGSELVRIAVNDAAAARAVPRIRDAVRAKGVTAPLIGDFHYNGHRLLAEHPDCAEALDKYRVNPGNVGRGRARDPQFERFVELACRHGKPVRVGVNWGSLDPALLAECMDANAARAEPRDAAAVQEEALVESALRSARLAEEVGLAHDRIVLSCKLSRVPPLLRVYAELGRRCDHPLHLGLTEAGMGTRAVVASSAALALLLARGLGDTLRVSLTPRPGGDRAEEVRVACDVLQSLGLRSFAPAVTACPGCGRTGSDYFQRLARDIEEHIAARMPRWKARHPGVEELTVAVMGCVVNGPGESRHADIGISLPGSQESPAAPVYIDGERVATLSGDGIAAEFKRMLDEYVARRFAADGAAPR